MITNSCPESSFPTFVKVVPSLHSLHFPALCGMLYTMNWFSFNWVLKGDKVVCNNNIANERENERERKCLLQREIGDRAGERVERNWSHGGWKCVLVKGCMLDIV